MCVCAFVTPKGFIVHIYHLPMARGDQMNPKTVYGSYIWIFPLKTVLNRD